jgi:hypothetical protein
VKTAFNKLQEVLGITALTEESENVIKGMEVEIKELKQTVVRLQQDGQAYKKANEVLTERLNEYEARLKEHGEMLRMIPTMQKQIAYIKGRIVKQKPETREKAGIIT